MVNTEQPAAAVVEGLDGLPDYQAPQAPSAAELPRSANTTFSKERNMTCVATSRAFVALSIFWGITSVAGADERLVPLDGSDALLKPSNFGYQFNKITDGSRVHLYFTLNEEAAKSFRGARLRLAKGGMTVVETAAGFVDTIFGRGRYSAGTKGKLLMLTLDAQAIDDGELVIASEEVQGQPRFKDFGGFRFSIKKLLALPDSFPDGGVVR
jgi:hypothetical protein